MDTDKIYEEALSQWRTLTAADQEEFSDSDSMQGAVPRGDDQFRSKGDEKRTRMLLQGDNLTLMAILARQIEAGLRSPVDLVYMDPPYFSNRDHQARIKLASDGGESFVKTKAFSDTWPKKVSDSTGETPIENYLAMLTPRLIAARELLSESGVFWLHLDRRAVHYARVMADVVFGGCDYLINEVIWSYKSGGSSTKRFANKHDTLLFYAKNKRKYKFFPQEEKSYNRALKPYRFKGVKEYRDDHGWYTIVNMKDVWEIPMVGRTAAERTGYATQKPEALLERIVLSCTEAGDVCLDPYGGSGTLAAVCERTGRGWISMDESPLALNISAERLGLK